MAQIKSLGPILVLLTKPLIKKGYHLFNNGTMQRLFKRVGPFEIYIGTYVMVESN